MIRLDKLPNIKNSLIKIAAVLNEKRIIWGLGGSLLLYLNGIETSVADIDIVIDEKDTDKLQQVITQFKYMEKQKNDIYLTERFYSITIDGIDIDLMVGFKIRTNSGIYSFPKGLELIEKTIYIDETGINICYLNDWLDAYKAMKRESKIDMIIRSQKMISVKNKK